MKARYLYNHTAYSLKKCPEICFEQLYYDPFIVTKALKYEPNFDFGVIMKNPTIQMSINTFGWYVDKNHNTFGYCCLSGFKPLSKVKDIKYKIPVTKVYKNISVDDFIKKANQEICKVWQKSDVMNFMYYNSVPSYLTKVTGTKAPKLDDYGQFLKK